MSCHSEHALHDGLLLLRISRCFCFCSFRSILLASLFPVGSDSDYCETTLSSVGRILADTTRTQSPDIVTTALLGLPNLVLSLAQLLRGGRNSASAKYITIMLDSVNIEGLVVHYTNSDDEGIKVSALLSLSRLAIIYHNAALVASAENCGSDSDPICKASTYLWQQIDRAATGMHNVIIGMLSTRGCVSDGALPSTKIQHRDELCLPAFSKSALSAQFSLSRNDSPRHWMARLFYLQTALDLLPESLLRSSSSLEFFSDKRHYGILKQLLDEVCGEFEGGGVTSAQIPPLVWFFLMPFLCRDTSVQMCAAKAFGTTLLGSHCKVFSAFFIPEVDRGTDVNHEIASEPARRGVDKLFSEIDFILKLTGGLVKEVLFSRELNALPSDGTAVRRADIGISLGVFRSLGQCAPLNTDLGDYIFQRSLLALIRIWIASSAGYALDRNFPLEDLACHASLASSAFGEIKELFQCSKDRLHPTDLVGTGGCTLSKIFSEFFLPEEKAIPTTIRYDLLTVFLQSFMLPTPAHRTLRAHDALDVSSVQEIVAFVDRVYPSIIVEFIRLEDHTAIQMCAAFRMHLLSEAKKLNNEEKRIQRKGLTELVVGVRKENKRSVSLSRSVVPGVAISTDKLVENAKLLVSLYSAR